jgi:hypothetical protein
VEQTRAETLYLERPKVGTLQRNPKAEVRGVGVDVVRMEMMISLT